MTRRVYVADHQKGAEETELLLQVGGLAVTGHTCAKGGWSVTHLPTGFAVAKGPFREDVARTLCHALAGLHDWASLGFDGAWRLRLASEKSAPVRAAIKKAFQEDAS